MNIYNRLRLYMQLKILFEKVKILLLSVTTFAKLWALVTYIPVVKLVLNLKNSFMFLSLT